MKASKDHAQHSVHPTGGSLRVFRQFVWLGVGSVKVALSRPTHQPVTQAVGQPARHKLGDLFNMINIVEILKDAVWDTEEPAKNESIERLVANAGKDLPSEYLALLRYSDGGEGSIDIGPGWLQLWSSEEVLQHNQGYQIEEYLPGFFGFGSSGGGELLAFDTRGEKPWKVVMIPFIPMSEKEAIVIAKEFEEFIRAIGRY